MKLFKTLLTILFISLLSSPSWSVTLGDLVERDGLYYEKFTDIPFTGEVTGAEQGSFKSGKKEGAWVEYHKNGQLFSKGNYKIGKRDGAWVAYHRNGKLLRKSNYKDGKAEGVYVSYHDNGQLYDKGHLKNGKKEGAWASYYEDGTVFKLLTETFKDGKKISD